VQADQPQSLVVTVIPSTPAERTTVGDVIIGSFGLAGALVLLALALGVVVAALRVAWIRRHPREADRLPPISPYVNGPAEPRSPRVR
jgi:hypothetical protein